MCIKSNKLSIINIDTHFSNQ